LKIFGGGEKRREGRKGLIWKKGSFIIVTVRRIGQGSRRKLTAKRGGRGNCFRGF